MKRIYMDHAATTPLRGEVLEAMMPYLKDVFGNPSSIHWFGREAKKAVEGAREKIANLLGAEPREILFTSGGSESDNMAIKGVTSANRKKGTKVITSSIEHHASLDSCKELAKQGFEIIYLNVDQYGLVDLEQLKRELSPDLILVSVIHANNEVGTIQPVDEIIEIVKGGSGAYVHLDSVQAIGSIPIDLRKLDTDLLSLSAHKFYGPKGIGALFIRKGTKISRFIHGGAQERNRRAGTENVAGIVGMATALELALKNMEQKNGRLVSLRDRLIMGIMTRIDHVKLNGHPTLRLPGNVNLSFEFIEGESLLLNLDLKGVAASSGSACTSGSLEPSHVLLSMGISHEVAHGSLRLSLGNDTTEEDVDYVLEILPGIVKKLREMSPLYMNKDCRI